MDSRTIYLKSYDLYQEVLRYELPHGHFAIISRQEFEALGIAAAFGLFTREGGKVAGIFASPEGPVIFLDSQQIVARYGITSANVEPDGAPRMQKFTLMHEGSVAFTVRYTERFGIGTNPYDTEVEDVDLFALIASRLCLESFCHSYLRAW